mmetsp:Transcript_1667/g.4094  ORF Transcript_1667/g.4094 Transcript_1667/m.4094 type:complete len:117 (+) Transcript_1667:66-416(+)
MISIQQQRQHQHQQQFEQHLCCYLGIDLEREVCPLVAVGRGRARSISIHTTTRGAIGEVDTDGEKNGGGRLIRCNSQNTLSHFTSPTTTQKLSRQLARSFTCILQPDRLQRTHGGR